MNSVLGRIVDDKNRPLCGREVSICVARTLIWEIKVWRYSFVDQGQYIIILRKNKTSNDN